ncbi:DUF5050 domain-containing protein [Paenibacillus spiritus]|uniref:DUF5050 domain-containing protein n=1 Tax=Paenibacillus spiritus TaxID=2496557 RepID=A0A5J5GDZ7_9BACL|nr:DUF5050 domain-containing protein [Paenibacillus spiritus]
MFLKKTVTLLGATALLLGGCGNSGSNSKDVWRFEGFDDFIARAKWAPKEKLSLDILAVASTSDDIVHDKKWLYYVKDDDGSIRKIKYNPNKAIHVKVNEENFTSKKDKKEYSLADTEALQRELGEADEIMVYSEGADELAMGKDTLYFIDDEDYYLFSIKTDGTNLTKLVDNDTIFDVAVEGDSVVYTNYDGIFVMDQDGGNKRQLTDDSADWLQTGNGWVYYSDTMEDDPVISRIKLDGSGKDEVLSGDFSEEQVAGDWIYFVRDDETYRSKGDGSKIEKLK